MDDDFVVTGTRPPSVTGFRPATATSKDFGYYTKNRRSMVDETLFQSHHSSPLNAPVTFAAPWYGKKVSSSSKGTAAAANLLKKKDKPVRPLLWAPDTSSTRFSINTSGKNAAKDAGDDASISSSSMLGTLQGVPLKHQYRSLKHTATFVDETLFGQPLLEPSFKAPWEEKRKKKQEYSWYRNHQDGDDRKPVRRRRPATALGLRGHSATSAGAVPIWKP